jgi:hypothetical protein
MASTASLVPAALTAFVVVAVFLFIREAAAAVLLVRGVVWPATSVPERAPALRVAVAVNTVPQHGAKLSEAPHRISPLSSLHKQNSRDTVEPGAAEEYCRSRVRLRVIRGAVSAILGRIRSRCRLAIAA